MYTRVIVAAALTLAAVALNGCGPPVKSESGAPSPASVEASASSSTESASPTTPEPTTPSDVQDTAYRKAHSSAAGPIHTPKSGSEERTAILDAVRRFHESTDKYIVSEMLVQGDWAICTVQPESAPSILAFLALRRENGRWVDVFASDAGEIEDWRASTREAWVEWGVPSTLVAAYRFKTP